MHPIATALDLAVCVMRAFNLAIIVKQSLVKSAPEIYAYKSSSMELALELSSLYEAPL